MLHHWIYYIMTYFVLTRYPGQIPLEGLGKRTT